MSIRMIILTDADDNMPFRIAAHSVLFYRPSSHSSATRVSTSVGHFYVTETVEEIDAKFYVPDSWQAKAVDEIESEDQDGSMLDT